MTLKPLQQQFAHRHPGTVGLLRFLDCSHLDGKPELQELFAPFQMTAMAVLEAVEDGPETTAFLRKLVEAKDCAVRARVAQAD
jgi:hypothetical protein